jgi:outer membrane protein assembly factor BamB
MATYIHANGIGLLPTLEIYRLKFKNHARANTNLLLNKDRQLKIVKSSLLIGSLVTILIVASFSTYFLIKSLTTSTTQPQGSGSGNVTIPSNITATNWLTYHRDSSRSGYDPTLKSFSSAALSWRSPTFDGDIYAEPLFFEGKIIIATENDSVYSIDAHSGAVLWRVHLGDPVPRSDLPCGDIDPTGITGTPVIDPVARRIYAVAFLRTAHHVLFALNIDNGSVTFQRDADPDGSDPTVQQQRAALSMANGMVYILYGGLFGDCGQYHGWVVGISSDGNGNMLEYQVPTGRMGGIWAPSGAIVDSSGSLYVTTGNGESTSTFDYGNSVIKLSSRLEKLDYFAPVNWSQLNAGDVDLGSTGPTQLGFGLLFQIGKEGVGYILNSTNLGGIGGQLYSANVGGSAFGGTAYSAPYILVPCTDKLIALKLSISGKAASFSTAWVTDGFYAGPPIIAGGCVWTVDINSGVLHAYAMNIGNEVFAYPLGTVTHFTTPMSSGDMLYVPAGKQIIAFKMS